MRGPDINWDPQITDYQQRIQNLITANHLGAENNAELTRHLAFIAEDYRQLLQDVRARRDPVAAAGGLAGRRAQIQALGQAARTGSRGACCSQSK